MFEYELGQLDKKNLRRRLTVVDFYDGPHITVGGRSLLLMCSNDYLGIANHPALCEAAYKAMKRYGFGAGASRLVSGSSEAHRELEERLARYKGTEAAIVFNSGYAANTGIIQSIACTGDVILSDCMNHASIVDGCRLSKADVHIYRHNDMNHVEEILKKRSLAGRKLIVTDGVFSMDGDIARLPDLVFLSEKHGATLMVDDAHATGVLGETGKGTTEHFGLYGRVHILMGTLGKALGSFGAFAAGSRELIEFLINRARTFIYSTALPPSVCAASTAAIDVVEAEPMRRESLWNNRKHLVAGLTALGISTGISETQIVPIIIGDPDRALKAAEKLFACGVYATAIRPPTVPNGTARIRMTLMSTHTEKDIDMVVSRIAALKAEGYLA